MKKVKGWNKLYLQILTIATIMFCMSLVVEIEFIRDLLFDKCDGCGIHDKELCLENDSCHVNYRGGVYYITGFILFTITIIRLPFTHEEEDFK